MDHLHANALLQSLKDAPLLVGELDEAASFNRSLLGIHNMNTKLNVNQKLGHLYEDALRLLLCASDELEVVADHVQVFDSNQITLGEMDFILRDLRTQQLIQLELAVKFYLGLPTADGWQFPGPDPHDNWARKLARLRSHQLQLSQRPEAQALFAERWGSAEVEVRQLIYGCLFYPIGAVDTPLPDGVAGDCRKGRWLYEAEWDAHSADVAEVGVIPKPLWPVEITDELRATLPKMSACELRAACAERCVMFVRTDSNVPHFLVPNDWHICQSS